jgi:methylphosphotriester-DNA--protein-cysteine methyltransferase
MAFSLVRRRRVVLDDCGTEITVAALTFAQVEALLASALKPGDGATPEQEAAAALAVQQVVCDGINNADPGKGLTADAVKQTMDAETFQAIYQAILDLSGLKTDPGKTPGETAAP